MLALPRVLTVRDFALRPETEADIPFLRRLFISTRWEELAPIVDWTEEQKRIFLEGQFAAQRHHYLLYYADCDRAVLEKSGIPFGRLYIDRQPSMLLVVDISLLPECRGRGIGTALLEAVIAEASGAGKFVALSVEKLNPALRLYRRLGFRKVDDQGVYWSMEWRPDPDVLQK